TRLVGLRSLVRGISSRSGNLNRTVISTGHASRLSLSILRCPWCRSELSVGPDQVSCLNERCIYSGQKFPVLHGQPVLIDFADSIFERSSYRKGNGSALPRDLTSNTIRSRLHLLADGTNPVAARNCDSFLSLIRAQARRPRVLVIGAGVIARRGSA